MKKRSSSEFSERFPATSRGVPVVLSGIVNLLLITCAAVTFAVVTCAGVPCAAVPVPVADKGGAQSGGMARKTGKSESEAVFTAGSNTTIVERPLSSPPPSRPLSERAPLVKAVSVESSGVPPAAPTASREVVFVAGGDVSFGREAGQRLLHDPEYAPLSGVDRLWADADLRFVNLESTLSDQQGQTQSPLQRLIFTGPPSGALALARAGVHWVSTANNHAWDYGPGAFEQTLSNLDAAGIAHAGTGPDLAAAYAPIVGTVGGWSVALFAVTHVWNFGPIDQHEARARVAWASFKALEPALRAARRAHDVVIVSYHGGAEYQDAPSDLTRHFMKLVMSTGVDFVVGHHPHVLQGVGFFEGRPVFYSLGNLLFGRRKEHPWTRYGLLARVRIAADGERSFAVCPYRIENLEPEAELSDAERSEVLQHLRLASTATGGLSLGVTDARGCAAVAPAPRRGAR